MNNLTIQNKQLPDNIEDLTQFVLVSKAKLQAYMLKLQTVNKLSVAQEIRDQTLEEAQEVSTALIAAEQRIGELLLSIPKASGGINQYNKEEKAERSAKSKSEVIAEMGYERHEASDYQQMAKHPEVVKLVLENAEANGEIPTKASVMREIKFYKERVKAQQEELEELRNKQPEIKTVVKEVEVVPDDYERIKSDYQRVSKERQQYAKEVREAKQRIRELESPSNDEKIIDEAKDQMDNFSIATYNYIRKYGGFVWAFDKWDSIPEDTKKNFTNAITALDGFMQQMRMNLKGVK